MVLGLGVLRRADRRDLEAGSIAQRARDRDHALILEREKIGSRLRPPLLHDPVEHAASDSSALMPKARRRPAASGTVSMSNGQDGRHDPPGNTPVDR
jgi:hypothetical protein